ARLEPAGRLDAPDHGRRDADLLGDRRAGQAALLADLGDEVAGDLCRRRCRHRVTSQVITITVAHKIRQMRIPAHVVLLSKSLARWQLHSHRSSVRSVIRLLPGHWT